MISGTFIALLIVFGIQLLPLTNEVLFLEEGFSVVVAIICIILLWFIGLTATPEYKIPNSGNAPTWRSVSLEQFDTFLEDQKQSKDSGMISILSFIFDNTIIKAIVAIIGLYFATFDIVKSALIIDIAFVPGIFIRPFTSPKTPYVMLSRSSKFVTYIIKTIEEHENNNLITAKPQFAIDVIGNNRPVIQDQLRINLEYPDMPDDWLCSTIFYTENDVQSKRYPYFYYVLVIKKKHAYSNYKFIKRIHSLIERINEEHSSFFRNKHIWTLETNLDGGNSVFVIRKSDDSTLAYTTSMQEAGQLPIIASEIYKMRYLLQDSKKEKTGSNNSKKKKYK